jgi:tRNA 2-thiouridine synthesizing protein C
MLSRGPFDGTRARDAIEAAMTCAVFGQSVSLLVLGDGVFCLNNSTAGSGLRNISAMIEALPLYEIREVAASARCLRERGRPLPASITPLDDAGIMDWIKNHDKHLSF